MEKRKIGRSGLETGPLALGTNVFGWRVAEPTAFEMLDRFADGGFSLIDTADSYSAWVEGHQGGESETIIGKWLKRSGRRADVLILTKVGKMPSRQGLRKENILLAAEESLKRLQTDAIDLYMAHGQDFDTPIAETLEAFDLLVRQGKARAVGASDDAPEPLAEALRTSEQRGYARFECVHAPYNLHDRAEFEKELAPVCAANGLGAITYHSLAMGFLTGRFRGMKDIPGRRMGEGAQSERALRILGALDCAARETGSSPAQVALAWLIARPGVVAPIAAPHCMDDFLEMLAGAGLRLDEALVAMLDEASAE